MIFFDTGAWVALSIPGDRHATAARRFHGEVGRGVHGAIVTTNFVLDEAATLVRMDADVVTASRLIHGALADPTVTVVWIGPEHFAVALEMFERHEDKRWSFTDCTSFATMKELNIQTAFAFDRNFEEAGFVRRP
jgi:predicted nucleic acid-binding protein